MKTNERNGKTIKEKQSVFHKARIKIKHLYIYNVSKEHLLGSRNGYVCDQSHFYQTLVNSNHFCYKTNNISICVVRDVCVDHLPTVTLAMSILTAKTTTMTTTTKMTNTMHWTMSPTTTYLHFT